ncbi:MAG: aminoglycoside phosphotransferase family protein [Alphaproteobacteria bacterium]
MNSSLLSRTPDTKAMALAERLLGQPVLAAWPVPRGGNNRIYLIDAGTTCYALKHYPRQASDTRDRLGTEHGAIALLHRAGFTDVPAPIARSDADGAALYEWIDGAPADEVGEPEIDAALDLLRRLVELSDNGAGEAFGPASAACFSAAEVLSQIQQRFDRLGREVTAPLPALRAFLDDDFAPVHHILADDAEHRLHRAGVPLDGKLAPAQRLLSPSDFGFHNVLRRPDGGYAFVDLEYFGWDDPAKLVSDFLEHPGHDLDSAMASRFAAGASALFAARDPHFTERLAALRRLFGLIWCLILLNEFLPASQARRGLDDDDAAAAQSAQLDKARDRLMRLWRHYESCQAAP